MFGDNQRRPPPLFLGRFARALVDLVQPSKPLIYSLTMVAGDEPHLAPQIVDMLSDELLRRPPQHRLPLLYLLDSIVKNLHGQFVPLFAGRLPLLVVSTYDGLRTGDPLQGSIMRLVDSWRDACTFPPEIILDLQQKLLDPPPPPVPVPPPLRPQQPPRHYHRPPPIKRSRRAPSMNPAINPPLNDFLTQTLDQYQSLLEKQKHQQQKKQPEKPKKQRMEPDFTTESLRASPDAAVAALYTDIPFQCEYCALRIRTKPEMATHLDWHFKSNRDAKLREKTTRSQLWFMSLDDWVKCSGSDEREAPPSYFDQEKAAQEATEAEPPQQVSSVVADDTRPKCSTCGELFEKFWDDNSEAWMYRDATETAGQYLVHMSCLDDKQSTAT